ncbi:MAG: substrate-binding periplasmic protein [Desulfovibrio sp.]
MKRFLFAFFLVLAFPYMAWGGHSDLKIMTEDYPPYNYQHEGQIRGLAVDILLRMFEITGEELHLEDIELLPWKRAYRDVLNESGTMLFGMTRTPEREDLFKWVGPITDVTIGLLALKGSDIEVDSLDDIKPYRVGVVASDVGEMMLLAQGVDVENMEQSPTPWSNILKLKHGRVDLFAYDLRVAFFVANYLGMPDGIFKPVYSLGHSQIYYAFHRDTEDQVIQKFQNALDELKRNDESGRSEYDRILAKYLH